MDRSHIRIVQRRLSDMGIYTGKIDGQRAAKTHKAVASGLPQLADVSDDISRWSDKRLCVASLQACAQAEGIDVGPIDGLWGPQTDYAVDALTEVLATGSTLGMLDGLNGPIANPNSFPQETIDQTDIRAVFGEPGHPDGSYRPPLIKVPVPWTMKVAWDQRSKRHALLIHERAAPSLKRALARIDAAYSSAQKTDLGLDLFGGDYSARAMRGVHPQRCSTHAWGIAIDFDPARNGRHANRKQARLGQRDATPFWDAWEAEGWCSIGRSRNYDFMHVQAAQRAY